MRPRGRPRLAALNDTLDTLEERRAGLEARLKQAPAEEDFGEKIKKLKAEVSPDAVELVINSAFYFRSENAPVILSKSVGSTTCAAFRLELTKEKADGSEVRGHTEVSSLHFRLCIRTKRDEVRLTLVVIS